MTQSFIAEITTFHPDLLLSPTIRELPEVSLEVESQPITPSESPSLFYSVSISDFDRFDAALTDDPTVDEWKISMNFSDCRVYQVYPSDKAKFTIPKITELGINILEIQNANQRWQFQFQVPDKETLSSYWQYCREEDVEFSLEKLYRSGPQPRENHGLKDQFTDRQLEVARTAARMGYFDPEGATATEVADELGISPSTLSTHLRRIMNKVFNCIFVD